MRTCRGIGEGGEREGTYAHSRDSSSLSSMRRNRVSRKALMSAYSARPSLSRCGSKVPMHPRRRCGRPGREGRVFHVTKSGLAQAQEQEGGKGGRGGTERERERVRSEGGEGGARGKGGRRVAVGVGAARTTCPRETGAGRACGT